MPRDATTLAFEPPRIAGRTFARSRGPIAPPRAACARKCGSERRWYTWGMNTPPSSPEDSLASLARLSDRQLLEHVGRMAGDERTATARLVASLAEVDRRQLYRDAGCSSLFTFCTDVLRLSESEAYLRIEAARAARKFPLVLERLAEASLTLTAVSKLARHLTEENHRALLDAVRHASKREIDEILAGLCPRPDAKEMIRRLPERPAPAAPAAQQPVDRGDGRVATRTDGVGGQAGDHCQEDRSLRNGEDCPSETSLLRETRLLEQSQAEHWAAGGSAGQPLAHAAGGAAIAALPPSSVLALAPQRYRVQLTIGAETNEKLRRVRDLLRRDIPDGDLATVFDRALTRLLAELEKKRFGATRHPKATRLSVLRRSPQVAADIVERTLPPAPASAERPEAFEEPKPRTASRRPEPATRERAEPVEALRPRPAPGPRGPASSPRSTKPAGSSSPSSTGSRASGQTTLTARRRSRHIPAAVKREVWLRDEGRCTFVGSHGRCRERGMLEYHHREPFAAGGEATVSNVALLCRAHTGLEAERLFGPFVAAIRRTDPGNSTAGMQDARERGEWPGSRLAEPRVLNVGDSTPSRRSP